MTDDIKKILESRHNFPHAVLGPHAAADQPGKFIIRLFLPFAKIVKVQLKQPSKRPVKMRKTAPEGLFEARVSVPKGKTINYLFQVVDNQGHAFELHDAYRFKPDTLAAGQETLFKHGQYERLFDLCGAHPQRRLSTPGVNFCVWAPGAQRVSVVGNFNRWDGRCHPMARISTLGFWQLFVPGVKTGEFYKFEIKSAAGDVFLKTDPYALQIEASPESAGIVAALNTKDSSDARRVQQDNQAPWIFPLTGSNGQTSAHELALADDELAAIRERGISHLEISGLYPQNNGIVSYFAVHPVLSGSERLQDFIARCHKHGLKVVMEGIYSRNSLPQQNLDCFDGRPLYEQQNQNRHRYCFAIDRPEVRCLFLSHALFWLEHFHVDGFRSDFGGCSIYRQLLQKHAHDFPGTVLLVCQPVDPLPIPRESLQHLFHGRLNNPFAILGPQRPAENGFAAIRAIQPSAQQAYILFPEQQGLWFEMQRQCDDGLWQAVVPQSIVDSEYCIHVIEAGGYRNHTLDPYALHFTHISHRDRALFAQGNHYHIYEKLGAHLNKYKDIEGVSFAVWAPNAMAVSVVGLFNHWDERCHPMQRHDNSGIWELFLPDLGNGELYKFSIRSHSGQRILKSDPFALFMETAPDTASIVYDISGIHHWDDAGWLEQRGQQNLWRSPISIYEVHLGSWMRAPDGRHLDYQQLAQRLIPYVREMGFTHIEILPIAEHPYEPSWGYQVSNFYAPTSRLGKPEQLMAFIDQCHRNGIGVLLDWVAGHFPKDAHALAQFDGTHLFEHADPRQGEHKDWGTLIFNYGRHEVENFLIANALFWLERYHFDGLRVDAVASMLYLDYSRKPGEWIPNKYGGNENLEAIDFLKHTNAIVHAKFPGVMMIAEESTSWPGVSRPTDSGGLGFGFKWNMGWMHDVLGYMQTAPQYRPEKHHQLVFVLDYAFEENFILTLSHDEVVHLKGSMYNKMPGTEWEKFANLRLLFSFMYTHPGKKLNFMGAEFAQIEEWNESSELQWQLLERESHRALKRYLQKLNLLYSSEPALYESDCRAAGFSWIDAGNYQQSIIVFLRKAKDPRQALVVICNFSAVSRFDFRVGVPFPVRHRVILDSNDVSYGGLETDTRERTIAISEIPWHG